MSDEYLADAEIVSEDELSERKLNILRAVVDDYITTGMPVGSRTISKKYMGLSSATIRNEMVDLEELGYLVQPHTSAGRIPSEKAYRLYVEKLMEVSSLTGDETLALQSHIQGRTNDLKSLLEDAAQAISDATTYTAFVLPPSPSSVTIQGIQLVPIVKGLALLVLVTDAGVFKDNFIKVSPAFTADDLHSISTVLETKLIGSTLDEVSERLETELGEEMESQSRVLSEVLNSINEQFSVSAADNLLLGGSTKILQHPEYASAEKAKSFIEAVESKESLVPILSKSRGVEFTVSIGSENAHDVMRDCSIVTVSYKIDDKPAGSIGVIGPTRMNYSHVTSVLNYMQNIISELAESRGEYLASADTSTELPEKTKQ